MIQEAFAGIFNGILGQIQSLKETLAESASMPLNGDRVAIEETASSTRQVEEASKSSPPRRRAAVSKYGQGFHKTGNPRGAKPIIPGGFRPQNVLHATRGSSPASHQQTGYHQQKRRPQSSQSRLLYSQRPIERRITRSSPSHDSIGEIDGLSAHSNDESKYGYGLHSPRRRRESHGHASLSPLPFEPEEQGDTEVYIAGESNDGLKWVRRGQKPRDNTSSDDQRMTKGSSIEDPGRRWDASSPYDPRPTSFKRTRQTASSPIPVSSRRAQKKEPLKSQSSLHVKSAWRGKEHLREAGIPGGILVRKEDKGLAVVIGADDQAPFGTLYDEIIYATYPEDEVIEHKNFVFLKLNSRGNGLLGWILFEFRSLPEPANEGAKPDVSLFVQWLNEKGVKTTPKAESYFKMRMNEAKQCNFRRPATPYPDLGPARTSRQIQPKPRDEDNRPRIRDADNRPRTRSQQTPHDVVDFNLADELSDHQQLGTERPVRKSARGTYKREVIEPPKPAPFPPQTWDQDLRFPFESRGASEVLTCLSLRTLDADQFLNDEVINFHLAIIKARLARESPDFASKVHIMNTYLYPAFHTKTERGSTVYNYDKVQRWTRNAKLFEKDLIVIPINEKFHWLAAVVCNLPAAVAAAKARERKAAMADELAECVKSSPNQSSPRQKQNKGPVPLDRCAIVILDSMSGMHTATLKAIRTYLVSEVENKAGVTLEMEDLIGVSPRKLPGQDNFSDCGVFMLHYIEKWLADPSHIKEKVYSKSFGTEEEARRLWSISEVANKRERMWRLYVKLYEEYENCLRNEPFDEFPEINNAPIKGDRKSNGEEADAVVDDAMIIDQPPSSPPAMQEQVIQEDTKRQASPAKRKSDGQENDDDRPVKRAKSDSPFIVEVQPRPTAASGLQPREISPEIPLIDDTPSVLDIPVSDEDLSLRVKVDDLLTSDLPLFAPNGLTIPLDTPLEEQTNMFDEIEDMAKSSPPPMDNRKSAAAAAQTQANIVYTPSMVAADSFDNLSIQSSLENRPRFGEHGLADGGGDTIMTDAHPRRMVDEIEETEDESTDGMKYNRGQGKGKSVHELPNDRIMDIPSSQDRREHYEPQPRRELKTPRKGTVNDPIFIDSQPSPKRTSPRTKSGNKSTRS